VTASIEYLNPAEAAKRLGVSAKALRLYEQRGLVAPVRTGAGWRAYGPEQMARAAEIAALRALGLSLAQVARVLEGDSQGLAPALAAHQASLEDQARQLAATVERVRGLRADLALGRAPAAELVAAFDLPWPWGGERFELRDVRPLNYIIGPLGSGKTRLIEWLAETLPNAVLMGLDRLADDGAAAQARIAADAALKSRVDRTLTWLVEDGAEVSNALVALIAGLEVDGADFLVVDMIEQGLDLAAQEALTAHLRRRGAGAPPLFLTTRSNAILDLAAVGPEAAIILCPANHNPPVRVAPYPGAPGYEAVATCLGSPEARARTEGVVSIRPQAA
jgi:DNA-binding transcriptional MerR regulator